jgi:hypothetical protein
MLNGATGVRGNVVAQDAMAANVTPQNYFPQHIRRRLNSCFIKPWTVLSSIKLDIRICERLYGALQPQMFYICFKMSNIYPAHPCSTTQSAEP